MTKQIIRPPRQQQIIDELQNDNEITAWLINGEITFVAFNRLTSFNPYLLAFKALAEEGLIKCYRERSINEYIWKFYRLAR